MIYNVSMKNSFIQTTVHRREREWSMAILHSHTYYEMYFLLSGKRQLLFEDKITELEEGSVAVISPFTMHKTEGGTFVRVNINFSVESIGESSRKRVKRLSSFPSLRFSPRSFEKIRDVLDRLLAMESGEESATVDDKRILTEYLIYLLDTHGEGELDDTFRVREKMPSSLLHILQYLNTHFHEKITLGALSERFFLSEVTLCHYFRKYLGVTFLEYLNSLRIARAKELLVTTRKSMDEIADEVGLGSANYFGLFFKRATGISPLQFRKL